MTVKRIRQKVLVLFFRLVMIVSLAGYSTYAVEAVMHSSAGSASVSLNTDKHQSHHEQAVAADPSDDGHDHDHYPGSEKSKASCCVDYCGVAALTCAGAAIAHPRSDLVLVALDDRDFIGRLPPLHRPPNI